MDFIFNSATDAKTINSICRICIKHLDVEYFNIFKASDLMKKIVLCTPLKVEENDAYPKNICEICYEKINDFHEFYKLCEDSLEKLQELLPNNVFLKDVELETIETNENCSQFDPLLPKMELMENEATVVDMLQKVDKSITEKDEPKKELITEECKKEDANIEEENDLEDFFEDNDDDDADFILNDNASDSDDSDNTPLAKRFSNNKKSKAQATSKSGENNVSNGECLEKTFECEICNRKFTHNGRYERHKKFHNENLPHKCEVMGCTKSFLSMGGLRSHKRLKHLEALKVTCPEIGCGKVFNNEISLKLHSIRVFRFSFYSYLCI